MEAMRLAAIGGDGLTEARGEVGNWGECEYDASYS